jgi:23S rRNA A1618 N6-methylase RlmF
LVCLWRYGLIGLAHEPMSLNDARALLKRNEHANHKCRHALETRNNHVYNNIIQKRDAYDFVFNNDTEYTPQGFNTSLCSLSEETTVGPYVFFHWN